MERFSSLPEEVRQYLVITGNYWSFTLTDGALRMLVVLHFYQLGYSPLQIAMLFLFYEFFGVVTNLVGGWLGAHLGLNTTMNAGLALQIAALSMLLVPTASLTVAWVMTAQALSGIAKDLNKMSAKSAIKMLVPTAEQSTLFKWVAVLTGSKNALKGLGFFSGAALLGWIGFHHTILAMVCALTVVWLFSLVALQKGIGKSSAKPKFTEIFSKSKAINVLSAARLFLFGARDVWFVVALPVYLTAILGWQHWSVGAFFAAWIIGYGLIQSQAPAIVGKTPSAKTAVSWCLALTLVAMLISIATLYNINAEVVVVGGLLLFGAIFAVNSALHSYLIVSYANADTVSMDVGFYYMANAMGRLLGTILSGLLYQHFYQADYQQSGLFACLAASTLFLSLATAISVRLPEAAVTKPAPEY